MARPNFKTDGHCINIDALGVRSPEFYEPSLVDSDFIDLGESTFIELGEPPRNVLNSQGSPQHSIGKFTPENTQSSKTQAVPQYQCSDHRRWIAKNDIQKKDKWIILVIIALSGGAFFDAALSESDPRSMTSAETPRITALAPATFSGGEIGSDELAHDDLIPANSLAQNDAMLVNTSNKSKDRGPKVAVNKPVSSLKKSQRTIRNDDAQLSGGLTTENNVNRSLKTADQLNTQLDTVKKTKRRGPRSDDGQLTSALITDNSVNNSLKTPSQLDTQQNTEENPIRRAPRSADAPVSDEQVVAASHVNNRLQAREQSDSYQDAYDESPVMPSAEPIATNVDSSEIKNEPELDTTISGTTIRPLTPSSSNSSISNSFELASLFGDSGETQQAVDSNDSVLDPVTEEGATSTLLADSSSIKTSWLEGFDNPGVNLRRFVTPDSSLIVDNEILEFSLGATHTGKSQDARLHQMVSLDGMDNTFTVKMSVLDSSTNGGDVNSSASNFVFNVPLQIAGSDAEVVASMSARVVLKTDPLNAAHWVTLGLYEHRIDGDVAANVVSLGETSFSLGSNSSFTNSALATLTFSLDLSHAGRVEVSVNDNLLSVPVSAQMPIGESFLEMILFSSGNSGEYSRIDVALADLSIDSETIAGLGQRLVLDNPLATVGHSLEIQNGAARLRASGANEKAKVMLATRLDETEINPLDKIESTRLITELSLHELALDAQKDSYQSEINILHTLFETSSQFGEQFIVAALNIKPTAEIDNKMRSVDVTARVSSIASRLDEGFNWSNFSKDSVVLADFPIGQNLTLTNKVPVQIELNGDLVLFKWGDLAAQIPVDHSVRWFPSVSSPSAAIVEAGAQESIVLELDYLGVTQR